MSESDLVISFENPRVPGNMWHGSMNFDPVEGCRAHVITEYDDPRIHPRDPLQVYSFRELPLVANLTDRIILADMDREGSGFSFGRQRGTLTEQFSAKVMVRVWDSKLTTLDAMVSSFTVRSPIVFSFIDHHAYQISIAKRNKRFTVQDRPFKRLKFEGQVFSKIELDIGRSMGDGSSGNVGKIEYFASATFTPRKPMQLIDIIRCAQFFEKLLFILVGGHCGPLEVSVGGGRRSPARAEIKFASPLYTENDVVSGIWRCWTLNKVKIDIGKLVDMAFGRYNQIKVPIELIIDAGSQRATQDKFFRLVRAMEAIARNLMPKGAEPLPPELTRLEALIGSDDKALKRFFRGRVKSIFVKANSLGYGIDLAMQTFPYPGVTTLDKRAVVQLRGIEAHARAHSFTDGQLDDMLNFGMQLDFLCRACVLLALGMTREQIAAGIPQGRFSWVLEKGALAGETEAA